MTTDPTPSTPTLAELLTLSGRIVQQNTRTFLPAKVELWDPSEQAVDVQPLIQQIRIVDGERIATDLPKISRVPVSFIRYGGFVIRCPLQEGDIVGLLVSDRELERWLSLECSSTDIVTPRGRRMHSLDDVVAYPGMSPWGLAIPGLDDGDLVIGREDGEGSVRITNSGEIILGSDSASKKGVARLDDTVKSTPLDDSKFWTWVLAVDTFCRLVGTAVLTGGTAYAASVPPGQAPTDQTGKIVAASGKVSTE
jgi:hypothetical protein